MVLPNYKDGSIVNLMASIENALGGRPKYKPLKALSPKELSKFKNIILIVVDGLGYEYVIKNGKGTNLKKYLASQMTSVFPSTTAACVTTFATGDAPQQHAITGWYTYLKEMGMVTTILPFVTRGTNIPIKGENVNPKLVFSHKSFAEKIKAKSYLVTHEGIVNTDYSMNIHKKFKRFGYNSLNKLFGQLKNIIKKPGKKFIYAYWLKFDNLCHNLSTNSRIVKHHFKEIDKKLGFFIKSIKDTNSIVIVTADHGLMNTTGKNVIRLKDHPKLNECLTLPLCGEPRAAYCYVRPSKVKQFESYVKTKLKKSCILYKSSDLIKKGYFGLFEPNKKLFDRIGDYVLILKAGYIIKDLVHGEKGDFFLGNHGGVSKEEMFVPLIVIKGQQTRKW